MGHIGRFWKNRYFLPHKSAKMSCLTLNWPLQAALKKGKIGVNTRFLESFDKKSVFGLVLAFSIRKKGAKKKKSKKNRKNTKKNFFRSKIQNL